MSTSAVIFDRDGVLIEDSGYPHRSEHLRWMPGAVEWCCARSANGAWRRKTR
jgi:histidinol phosphatase-like enzyme